MPYKDKVKRNEYAKEHMRKRRESRKIQSRELRKKVLDILGGKCVYCGCDNINALEINHKNGGGNKEWKEGTRRGGNAYLREFLDGTRNIEDYETTCRVCNAWHYLVKIKGLENKWKIMYNK